eukprot:jgi/Botrbrau1/12804/Bobra.117_1s0020.1
MGTFSSQLLLEKLTKLNTSQQSIETVSQWCQFHRKEAKQIVTTWEAEFSKQGPMVRKLALLYVANDILQNSRKKGPEFVAPFYHPIIRAIKHMLKHGDEKTKGSVLRLLNVMDERRVFGVGGAKTLKELVSAGTAASESTGRGGSKGQGAAAEAVPQATPPERKLPPALVPSGRRPWRTVPAAMQHAVQAAKASTKPFRRRLWTPVAHLRSSGPAPLSIPMQRPWRPTLQPAPAPPRCCARLLDAQTEVGEQIKQQLLRCRKAAANIQRAGGAGAPAAGAAPVCAALARGPAPFRASPAAPAGSRTPGHRAGHVSPCGLVRLLPAAAPPAFWRPSGGGASGDWRPTFLRPTFLRPTLRHRRCRLLLLLLLGSSVGGADGVRLKAGSPLIWEWGTSREGATSDKSNGARRSAALFPHGWLTSLQMAWPHKGGTGMVLDCRRDSGGFGKANGAHGGPADDVASAAAQMAAQLASDTAAQSALLEALKPYPGSNGRRSRAICQRRRMRTRNTTLKTAWKMISCSQFTKRCW